MVAPPVMVQRGHHDRVLQRGTDGDPGRFAHARAGNFCSEEKIHSQGYYSTR